MAPSQPPTPNPREEDQCFLHVGGGTGTYEPPSSTSIATGLNPTPNRNGRGAALDAIRGQELSKPSLALTPRTSEPSECSDLGARDYWSVERHQYVPLPKRRSDECLSDFVIRQYECLDTTKLDKGKNGFLPKPLLEAIFTEDTVTAELSESLKGHSDGEITSLARRISGTDQSNPSSGTKQLQCYRMVFAILARICKLDSIADFVNPETGVTDADLPLEKVQVEGSQKPALRRMKDHDTPIRCFSKWASFFLEGFYDYQWTLLAPFFSRSERGRMRFQHFHHRVILPFTQNSPLHGGESASQTEDGGKGGFGEVRMVVIHPAHHNFQGDYPLLKNTGFALKRLNTNERSLFEKEVSMLGRFSVGSNAHPHLICLLTTFEQDGSFYLLFPCADSDLYRFWTKNQPEGGVDLAPWVAEQCLGIADGLSSIHNYKGKAAGSDCEALHGRHGDIKPENILWFKSVGGEGGTLVISDFGCTVFNTRKSCSNVPNDKVPRTPTYRPPEADIKGAKISRSWDIWTLGCVYLEFLTWLLGGAKLLEEFSNMRLEPWVGFQDKDFRFDFYFNFVGVQGQDDQMAAVVKPKVIKWIAELHNHPSCTEFVHDFIHLIQDEMIIVESPHSKRTRCDRLKDRLGEMYRRCLDEDGYCSTPTPREVPESPCEPVPAPMSDKFMDAVRKNVARDRSTLVMHGGPTTEAFLPAER